MLEHLLDEKFYGSVDTQRCRFEVLLFSCGVSTSLHKLIRFNDPHETHEEMRGSGDVLRPAHALRRYLLLTALKDRGPPMSEE